LIAARSPGVKLPPFTARSARVSWLIADSPFSSLAVCPAVSFPDAIPLAILDADPRDLEAWSAQARGAIAGLL